MKKIIESLYRRITGVRISYILEEKENYIETHNSLLYLQKKLSYPEIPVVNIHEAFGAYEENADCNDLKELFNHYGSDKSTRHEYHLAYAAVLDGKRAEKLKIFEIGLGTNNVQVKSNMGKDGKPGASIRAFRDWAKNAEVFGADIDKDILFEEERIRTFFIDQTNHSVLEKAVKEFKDKSFDLIIDDGLHNTRANISTISEMLRLVKDDGALVIEDIDNRFIPIWKTVIHFLSNQYNCQLISERSENILIIKPKA